ncbi:MAG: CHASE4 domain-containing protein [Candidatus Eremiobacterota bacterium]
MNLHKKALFIIITTFIILIGILYIISRELLLRSFSDLEKEYTKKHLYRTISAIEHETSSLDILLSGWAPRDDTYNFILDKNNTYIQKNLTTDSFTIQKINILIFTNNSGEIVYGKHFDLEKGKEVHDSDKLFEDLIKNYRILTEHKHIKSHIKGIVLMKDKPLLVASQPVITSNYKGPVRGALIVGRYLNSKELKLIENEVNLPVKLYALKDPCISPKIVKNLLQGKTDTVQILNNKIIAGYTVIMDIYKKPVFILKIDVKRDIYRHGEGSIIYFLVYFLLTGLIISFITIIILDKMIMSRLMKLNKTVNTIGKTGNLSDRLSETGTDEFSGLAQSINEMLKSIEDSQEELNKAVMNSITSQIAVLDRNGIITSVNDAWERFSRERKGEEDKSSDIGEHYIKVWESETGEFSTGKLKTLDGIGAVIKGESMYFSCEYQCELPSRTIWLLLNATPLAAKKGGTVISRMDITERKKAEENLIFMEKQLRQAQKLEAIGTLAGGIAHDFNNILSAIMGYTEMTLVFLVKEEGKLKNNLQKILKASRRAADLVSQILTFSRQSEHEKQIIEIKPVIKEVIKLLRATLPSTVEIRHKIDVYSDKILGDPTQIHQILMNLSTNAAYSMKDKGGTLEIILTEIEITESTKTSDLLPGSYIQLTVKDTGKGIDQKVLDKIFDPFFTTKPQGEGTGLGLSVVHGIVKSYEGSIEVTSKPGEGSTFNIYLPSVEGGDKKKTTGDLKIPPSGKGHILIVDDEEDIVYLTNQLLLLLGYEVTGKTGSKEALETFQREPGKFTLIITDYTMPHMTGIDLAREVIKIKPDIPIVLCTGFNDSITLDRVSAFGIREILFKPVNLNILGETINNILVKRAES